LLTIDNKNQGEIRMVFIYSLIFAALFSLLLTESIKKNAKSYYLLAVLVSGSTIAFELYRLLSGYKLTGILNQLERASARGIIATAFFILVMFAGGLNMKWQVAKRLMKIRAELAIIASTLMLAHGIVYLVGFFINVIPRLTSGKGMSFLHLMIYIVGIVAFFLMIPLFITSFKKIRKNMNPKVWKNLQRWSYLFYFLGYLHIIIILVIARKPDLIKIISYNAAFGIYTVLKIVKELSKKQQYKLNLQAQKA
jgi:DMSO/TMAO reductase YedYZ heme-binding membrane subunit